MPSVIINLERNSPVVLSCQTGRQSVGKITSLSTNHASPDGKWRQETAKQMLNVPVEILHMLNGVKITYLMVFNITYNICFTKVPK